MQLIVFDPNNKICSRGIHIHLQDGKDDKLSQIMEYMKENFHFSDYTRFTPDAIKGDKYWEFPANDSELRNTFPKVIFGSDISTIYTGTKTDLCGKKAGAIAAIKKLV